MPPRWLAPGLMLILLGAAACDSRSLVRVITTDAAVFRPTLAKAVSGEWSLIQPVGDAWIEGSPCRTSLSISIEELDPQQYPHDPPRGSARLALCGVWRDVAIDQIFLEYEGREQSEASDPAGAACVLRSLDPGDAESRWLLRWRPHGNQLMVTCDLPPDPPAAAPALEGAPLEVMRMSEEFNRVAHDLPPALPSLTYERRP